ncbi:hypothetical protein CF8_3096 [Nocardioides sp. CF8]|uniref:hypothetical protein n=1 Tax=Nocardioides sp. CF8 TaxID=110319 RepID=UPI0003306924|nr:hypothetical protein [Nocardioides sp. CF8]EON23003.1 hypothetical protein CF8_3096 [Nocardioides sp. CF8]
MRRLLLLGLLTLALTGCSQEHEPGPGKPPGSSSPATVIPEDFPLADEMHDDVHVSAQSVGMRSLDFCGRKPLRGLAPADRLAAEASGDEYASTRDLMLFDDTSRPEAVVRDVRAAAIACPAEEVGPGARLLTEVRESSFGPAAATVVHTYEQDGEVGVGAEVIEVVQVGRALLVTSTYGEWDPANNLDEGITEDADLLAATVEAMAAFEGALPAATP